MLSSFSILYVSYPLLTISEKSAGGAEQVLLTVEREMAAAGHRTAIAACDGSEVSTRLLGTGPAATDLDDYQRREREHHGRVLEYLRRHPQEFDIIHDHSGSFFRAAAESPVPVLASLHLPRGFYPSGSFDSVPSNVAFNCVSQTQARSFGDAPNLVGVIQNGIAYQRFPVTAIKDNYVLWMGRICEEKAPHLAIAAAKEADVPLVIAGQVYPFSYHRDYFAREIRPHLTDGSRVCYVEAPSFAQKIELLCNARALLLTSTAEETSSLVAMEAMACGTPVVALASGAFPEIISDGETGFVVDTIEQIALVLPQTSEISPGACRTWVERNFSARNMGLNYELLYQQVLMRVAPRTTA